MTYTPDEDFADFLTKFGRPFAAKAADEAVLQKYRGILPDQLLTYWRQYGFCGFADGLFWITNPDDYEDILTDCCPPIPTCFQTASIPPYRPPHPHKKPEPPCSTSTNPTDSNRWPT